MNVLELDARLNALIIARKEQEAFVTYYADDVVSQENDEPERVGRDEWMKARQEAEVNIKRFKARVLAHAANGDTSLSEWHYTVELEGLGTLEISQVAVRRWKDGRVVKERFYHK